MKFLTGKYPSLSGKKIKQLIDQKVFFVNQYPERFSTYRLQVGDKIFFDERSLTTLNLSEKIFEDEDIIIFNKGSYISSLDPMQVHRLDKETTGVHLIAKNEMAKKELERQFKEKQIHKVYLAISVGHLKEKEGERTSYLQYRQPHQDAKYGFESIKKEGLLAHTKYKTQRYGRNISLIECTPTTGRTHQLRIHLSALHVPILGDDKYAGKKAYPFYVPRFMLHCLSVRYFHPVTKKLVEVTANIPDDFQEVLDCRF
ncbi:MAG: RluA family pseudouridine synthase [Chlamydiales bacterium]|nr:RluA family pseudouridine synthase [Chlamydiales bacterium]